MDAAGYRAPAAGQQRTPDMVANMASGLNHGFLLTGGVLVLGALVTLLFLRPDRTAGSTTSAERCPTAADRLNAGC
jgi:hypothetical protein